MGHGGIKPTMYMVRVFVGHNSSGWGENLLVGDDWDKLPSQIVMEAVANLL